MIDLQRFYRVTRPNETIRADDPQDQKYYVDFSSVRGGRLIEDLKNKISLLSPDDPTCALFTGHIGCGKSTELMQLKVLLEEDGFHVVYFESSQDLEMADVDIGDVMLAIAKRISESLEAANVRSTASGVRAFLEKTKEVLKSDIDIKVKAEIPGLGKVGVDSKGKEISLAAGIAELTMIAKNDAGLREKLNQFLAPQKNKLLDAINQELIVPAIAQLKAAEKKGLVVIVDNLDRVDRRVKPSGKTQHEYLFIDQSDCLTKFQCHLVYTIPLSMKFTNEYGLLTQRYEEDPKVLPMVPVMTRDGQVHEAGMALLRQMVLRRALPDVTDAERCDRISEIFDRPESLDRLCQISGGHSRDLLRLLNTWIGKGPQLPLNGETLERVIRERRNEMVLAIDEAEWELLRQVRQRKMVSGDQGYQVLISSRWVFEYRQDGESWFDVNPILLEAREFQG